MDQINGDIFFFNRKGKFLKKINRKGQGPEEHINAYPIVDFDNEEVFVEDPIKETIFRYSFDGQFIAALPFKRENMKLMPAYDYDKDYLIGYNQSINLETGMLNDVHPFYLVSKKDGERKPINITVKNRISDRIHSEKVDLGEGQIYRESCYLRLQTLFANGRDFLLVESGSDTLFTLKEGVLTPIAVQFPASHSTKPPVVIAPEIYTDNFLYFRPMKVYYNPDDSYAPYYEAPTLVWDRKTNKIEEWRIYNPDHETKKFILPYMYGQHPEKNSGVSNFFSSDFLLKHYEEGRLSGKLKEIASRLHEEDNPVLIIAKYK